MNSEVILTTGGGKKNQCLPGPGAGPAGAMAPAFVFGPGPAGAMTPVLFFGPGPAGAMAPVSFFGPGPAGAVAPVYESSIFILFLKKRR